MSNYGFDSFPSFFNSVTSQQLIQAEKERKKEQEQACRMFVLERYKKFIDAGKPYFQVDLTDYPAEIRVKIITEVRQRFNGVGYREPEPQPSQHELLYNELMQRLWNEDPGSRGRTMPDFLQALKPQPQRRKVIRINDPMSAGQYTQFFIALTPECDKILETYNW